MTVVINVEAAQPLIDQLGWKNFNFSEVLDQMSKHGVSSASAFAYLKALAASPEALDDSTIPGCDPGVASLITSWLKSKSLVA